MDKNNVYLASKPRYEILDGLRGVAAVLVVLFHIFEPYSSGPRDQIINHGYLAVDFFFALSGYVIGYAYDDRWDKMSRWNFYKRRLVRLHPMVIMGTFLGLCTFYLADSPTCPLIHDANWLMVLGLALYALTMLPSLPSWDIRGWVETNTFAGPVWSLQYEYVANILYALFFRKMSKVWLSVFVVLFGLLTINLCLSLDLFGLWTNRTNEIYTVIGGWSFSLDQIVIALTRVLFPFFAGLLLSRMGKVIKVRGGFWWCTLLIIAMLAMPRIGSGEWSWLNGLYEAVCIIVLFPIVLAVGAGSKMTNVRSKKICTVLGELSYPLYITHYTYFYLMRGWLSTHQNVPLAQHIMVNVGLFFMAIMTAYASYKLYDVPVRDWLRRKLFKSSQSTSSLPQSK